LQQKATAIRSPRGLWQAALVLIQTAYRQPFAKMMWCPVKDAAMGRPRGEITMSEDLNEVDLVETDAFAPSSDIALAVVISQKITPSPSVLEERDRQYELRAQQSLTAAFFGDPLPGRSALDRWRTEQERIARQSKDEED
jgi:hypothetical protein